MENAPFSTFWANFEGEVVGGLVSDAEKVESRMWRRCRFCTKPDISGGKFMRISTFAAVRARFQREARGHMRRNRLYRQIGRPRRPARRAHGSQTRRIYGPRRYRVGVGSLIGKGCVVERFRDISETRPTWRGKTRNRGKRQKTPWLAGAWPSGEMGRAPDGPRRPA